MSSLSDFKESLKKTQSMDSFYVSFSDLMVLLCVFFVMILGISKIDIGSFEKVKSGFAGSSNNTLVSLATQLKKTSNKLKGVSVELASDGVRIDFESAALFKAGSAVLRQEYMSPLKPMLEEIKSTKYSIEIEGHTEDRDYFRKNGEEIETNWSLSGKRAGAMADYLGFIGFKESRLRIVGYSFTRPKVSIKGLSGNKLAYARAKNRRVTLLVK